MRIAIHSKLTPFSHEAGKKHLLPGSNFILQIFPAKIEVFRIDIHPAQKVAAFDFAFSAFVKQFTVIHDLYRNSIWVSGKANGEFFRYCIRSLPSQSELILFFDRNRGENIDVHYSTFDKDYFCTKQVSDSKKQFFCLTHLSDRSDLCKIPIYHNELFFHCGVHKFAEWERIHKRGDLEEILPIWLAYANCRNIVPCDFSVGNIPSSIAPFFKHCLHDLENRKMDSFQKNLLLLWKISFDDCGIPIPEGNQNTGLQLQTCPNNQKFSAKNWLDLSAQFVLSLFIRQQNNEIWVLPYVPPQVKNGRLINIRLANDSGSISLEWSLGKLRKMELKSFADQKYILHFPKSLASCRLQFEKHTSTISVKERFEILSKKEIKYDFDYFEK